MPILFKEYCLKNIYVISSLGLGNELAARYTVSIKNRRDKMMFKLLSVCVLAVFLTACGNKGALYLPSDAAETQQESSL
ncbi:MULTISPECIES: LPS translocon maturation chaperone LptM [unclassified Marinomonas]|jgi:predicted small lipoprotein YifL|uniref:LPS translocon maturation chaperone LptM n=1 Tax=unclassified Marinomonas TaxID=196814 RepID=UPI0006621526|nr:lipoprotein [Marinomonas sp. UCMA 3892]